MPTSHKKLVVIEGPAGSGKTTLLKNLQANIEGSSIAAFPIERPRDYSGPVLEGVAIIKDLAQLVTAFTSDTDVVFLDRWAVSQFVYSTYRSGLPPDPSKWDKMMMSMIEIRSLIRYMLQAKDAIPEPFSYETKWVFLLPPLPVIEYRRNKEKEINGRDYPFEASLERGIFQWCIEHWHFAPCIVLDGTEYTVDVADSIFRPSSQSV